MKFICSKNMRKINILEKVKCQIKFCATMGTGHYWNVGSSDLSDLLCNSANWSFLEHVVSNL